MLIRIGQFEITECLDGVFCYILPDELRTGNLYCWYNKKCSFCINSVFTSCRLFFIMSM